MGSKGSGRPKPTELCKFTRREDYISTVVTKARAVYAVFFDGKPCNVMTKHELVDKPSKYKRVSSVNKGHIINMAEKLNKMFKTDKFSVVQLRGGEVIGIEEFEDDED
jgi:hypothetical protein